MESFVNRNTFYLYIFDDWSFYDMIEGIEASDGGGKKTLNHKFYFYFSVQDGWRES